MTVVQIKETNIYNGATNSTTALGIMKAAYEDDANWHTAGINLHIALLGEDLGGGIAYVGGVCRPNIGFAVSGDLIGTGANLGQGMYWDIYITAHELG